MLEGDNSWAVIYFQHRAWDVTPWTTYSWLKKKQAWQSGLCCNKASNAAYLYCNMYLEKIPLYKRPCRCILRNIKFSGLVDRRNINFHPKEFSILSRGRSPRDEILNSEGWKFMFLRSTSPENFIIINLVNNNI